MEQLSLVDLSDDEYTIKQASVRNKYEATNAAGDTVLRGNHKMFQMKDEVHFTDADGTDVFKVKAEGTMDIAGDYHLVDSDTGEEIAVLDNDFSILQDTWRIRDPDDGSVVAEIDSRGAVVTLARKLVPGGAWIPHRYEITDGGGSVVGTIDGQFSFRDTYEVSLEEYTDVPRAPVVAGAMVIDAIQGN